jgi:hypothetical protein
VQEFNSSGSWIFTFPTGCADTATPGCAPGSGNGQFTTPVAIAIH